MEETYTITTFNALHGNFRWKHPREPITDAYPFDSELNRVLDVVHQIEKELLRQTLGTKGTFILLLQEVQRSLLGLLADTVSRFNLVVFENDKRKLFMCATKTRKPAEVSAECPIGEETPDNFLVVLSSVEFDSTETVDFSSTKDSINNMLICTDASASIAVINLHAPWGEEGQQSLKKLEVAALQTLTTLPKVKHVFIAGDFNCGADIIRAQLSNATFVSEDLETFPLATTEADKCIDHIVIYSRSSESEAEGEESNCSELSVGSAFLYPFKPMSDHCMLSMDFYS